MWNLLMDIHLVQTPPIILLLKQILIETNYTLCKVNLNSHTHHCLVFPLVQCFLQSLAIVQPLWCMYWFNDIILIKLNLPVVFSRRKSKWQIDRGLIIALFFIRMFKIITPEALSLQLPPIFFPLSLTLSFHSHLFLLQDYGFSTSTHSSTALHWN